MRDMWKQIGELDVVDGPAVLAEEPKVSRRSFEIARDAVNHLKRFNTIKESLVFFYSGVWLVKQQGLHIAGMRLQLFHHNLTLTDLHSRGMPQLPV